MCYDPKTIAESTCLSNYLSFQVLVFSTDCRKLFVSLSEIFDSFCELQTQNRAVSPFSISCLLCLQMLLLQIWKKTNECLSLSTWVSASESVLSIKLKGIRYFHMKEDYYCESGWRGRAVGTECISNNLKCIRLPLMLCSNQ